MLMGPNKKAAMLIAKDMKTKPYVQKMGEGGVAVEIAMSKPEESDKMMAKESQAQKIMSAMESKDPKALVKAFEGMMSLCAGEEDMEEEDSYGEMGDD